MAAGPGVPVLATDLVPTDVELNIRMPSGVAEKIPPYPGNVHSSKEMRQTNNYSSMASADGEAWGLWAQGEGSAQAGEVVSSGKVSQSTEGLCLQDEGSEGSKSWNTKVDPGTRCVGTWPDGPLATEAVIKASGQHLALRGPLEGPLSQKFPFGVWRSL
ncbi:hypothetical protein H8959_022185 [Pygathrix nigripes]